MDNVDTERLERALDRVRSRLLAERNASGHWVGELSTSALSTATAVFALMTVDRESAPARAAATSPGAHATMVERGLAWLAQHANADGGWGDTVRSKSNLSTTVLCWAALGASASHRRRFAAAERSAEDWIRRRLGDVTPRRLVEALAEVYGKDRTFSVPILTMCALAGRLGPPEEAWSYVKQLPFELAACPRSWFKFLGLPVVSYALPALIAVGQARHHRRPTRNPISRFLRGRARRLTLRVLGEIQPESGGFLEATPLTSFVTMSLAASGEVEHSSTKLCVRFLERSVRADGSWPIDTNLATWVTTLAVNALAAGNGSPGALGSQENAAIRDWLLAQQYDEIHRYTQAAPGAWAWTDLPGGVPDADDTAGALLALRSTGPIDDRVRRAAAAGAGWLLDLQNRDGGMPTFCRGWGKLPFDRSGPDLTAHALRAWSAWREDLPAALAARIDRATDAGLAYLRAAQRDDGAWVPLWFGSEEAPRHENPTYGTARVLAALRDVSSHRPRVVRAPRARALDWILKTQNPDGGWGGDVRVPSSIEETALVVEALAENGALEARPAVEGAIDRGAVWLLERTDALDTMHAAPIGFYFAVLWYYEKLYPLIFTTAALSRLRAVRELTAGR